MDQEHSTRAQRHEHRAGWWALPIAALGVVYGDIGTSPLYAMRECFHGPHAISPTPENVLGIMSLLFWTLIFVISIKYMIFVLSADNRGEGGILALLALACPRRLQNKRPLLIAFGLFGASLLYGDGVITPAISVLSAMEGLKLATPMFEHFVLPLTVLLLFLLFFLQKRGTAKIGAVFGPIILLWFCTIAFLGVQSISKNWSVLQAINPYYAAEFLTHNGWYGFLVLGAVFLVTTGGEALYADMGHFGKRPIRWVWFIVVLPSLLLNYFGQGALLLANPAAAENPFYLLAPSWALLPLVILAAASTVIASQALISGVFSLTRQAIQLGFSPRMQIVHTSQAEIGQIYMPQVNWALCAATIWLVLTFKSSSALAAAYGISVATTMVITTSLMFFVAKKIWRWPLPLCWLLTLLFISVDLAFFSANIIKVEQGGWFPLMVGMGMFTLMSTWRKGRKILAERLRNANMPLDQFLAKIQNSKLSRVSGTALFMVGDPDTTPPALVHNVKHNKVMHDVLIILTIITKEFPFVRPEERLEIRKMGDNFYRVIASYGFMDTPDVPAVVAQCRDLGIPVNIEEVTYFLGRETLIASERPGMAIWREHLFSFMSRNAQRATAFFNIPPNQVIEVGMQVEI